MARSDVCEAFLVLEMDYQSGPQHWLQERSSNQRRQMSIASQLRRMHFVIRPNLGSFEDLTPEGQAIYIAKVLTWRLPVLSRQYQLWISYLGMTDILDLVRTYGPPELVKLLHRA